MDVTRVRRWWRPVAAISLVASAVALVVGVGLAPSARTPTKPTAAPEWPWSISLHVSRTTVTRGTPIPATITLVNLTRQAIVVTGCDSEQFPMTVGNSRHPNLLAVPTDYCETHVIITPGAHVFRTVIATTFQSCGFAGDPQCRLSRSLPALPAGTYRTEIVMPDGLDLRPPAPVTIRLTP